jgi:hypothetical protein
MRRIVHETHGIWTLVLGGWALSALVTFRAGDVWAFVVFALFALLTLFLAAVPDFPRRHKGLVGSWLGPLILSAGTILGGWFLEAFSHSVPPNALGVAQRSSTQLLIGGLVATALSMWFFRGFGMIAFAATVAVVSPRYRESAIKAARDYPWRAWWAVPLWFLVLTALSATGAWTVCTFLLKGL